MGIREPAADMAGSVLHVVDRWQHLGTARDDSEVADLIRSTTTRAFDPDAYRIMARCLDRLSPRDLVMLRTGKR